MATTPPASRRGAAASHNPATQRGDQSRTAGAAQYLADLPSRGLFSSTVLSSNLGGIRIYICDHDTSPPEEKQIKTNPTNILIRSLQLNKQRGDVKEGKAKAAAESNRGKRCAERTFDGRASAKRANVASGLASPRRDESKAVPSDKELQAFTVERLRALLKERGLSAKGKKDELILRLKDD
uniref:Apurinic endonuclease-redox protein n=1 Tax=Anthurium amnicola TaxID=1678845 RepID=A0A1D1YYX9_9ARAE